MWIIPKNYQPSSVFVLATVESKEDLSLQGLNIESSLMWRSKPSPLRTWSQRWSRVSWFRLLSTRILRPSHLISFETQLTSSLEDIRANRLAWQEKRLQQKNRLVIPDTSSPTSSTMSEQLDLLSASSRMSKDTSTEDLNQSSKTWKEQVTIQRGEYSQRKKLAHLTRENASSFLPTPTATPYGNNQGGAAGRTGQVRHSLESMAKHDLWPTPTASDHKGSGPTNIRKDGKDRKKDRLDYAVEQKSGTLNPNWVEWLMGVPTGWTELDSWVTELSPKQPPEHGRS